MNRNKLKFERIAKKVLYAYLTLKNRSIVAIVNTASFLAIPNSLEFDASSYIVDIENCIKSFPNADLATLGKIFTNRKLAIDLEEIDIDIDRTCDCVVDTSPKLAVDIDIQDLDEKSHTHWNDDIHFGHPAWIKPMIELNNDPGYTYFIQDSKTKEVKIGCAINPEKRLKELQTGNPHKLILLYSEYTSNMRYREQYYHSRFEEYRVNGEWFEYYGKLQKFIIEGDESRQIKMVG